MKNPFEGRLNQPQLEKKRDEYIEQAVARLDSDEKFLAELDGFIGGDIHSRLKATEKVITYIEGAILEDHHADKDTSQTKINEILREYPEDIISARAEKWESERANALEKP